MKLALVVIGDGRDVYLNETMRSIKEHVLHPISARCMVNDEADPAWCDHLNDTYPDWAITHTGRKGMAGAVQAGFDLALSFDPDYTLWVEEDMQLIAPLPIREAADRLVHDISLAQMLFKREATPFDGTDDIITGMFDRCPTATQHLSYATQDYIFSMNPSLIPRWVMELGYDKGNEAGMTEKLRALGCKFGVWGRPGDPPLVRHIGAMRTAAWQL